MTETGPDPKSDEELEAELAQVRDDVQRARAEADQPDIFRHPEQLSTEEFFEEAAAEAKAERAAEDEA